MRQFRFFMALALLVGGHAAWGVPEGWAQQGPPQSTPSGTQPAIPAEPGRFSETDIPPDNVAKDARFAEWVAKHPRLEQFLEKHPGLAEKLAKHPRAAHFMLNHPGAAKFLAEHPRLRDEAR